MANTFKNYTATATGIHATTVYTVPAATTGVVVGINVANLLNEQITIDVVAGGVHIVKNCPLPSGAALSPLEGKIILEASETVTIKSNRNLSCDVIVSVMEQT